MSWRRVCLPVALLSIALPLRAEGRLEIITLRHRPAAQIVPALRPLVESGGALSTLDDKILLRVSPANLAELRAAIDTLDTPLRRLVVSVRQEQRSEGQGGEVGVSGRLRPGASRVLIEGGAGRQQRADRLSQQVQVIEGGQALIQVGQSLPLALREWRAAEASWIPVDSVRYVDVGSGFLASPRLSGEDVSIEIAPRMERMEGDGRVTGTRLATTVSGRLGQWIPLGGSQLDTDRSGYGTGGFARGNSQTQAQVWLRVDPAD